MTSIVLIVQVILVNFIYLQLCTKILADIFAQSLFLCNYEAIFATPVNLQVTKEKNICTYKEMTPCNIITR